MSPTTNAVPIACPSRPSRAISMATRMTESSTSGSTPVPEHIVFSSSGRRPIFPQGTCPPGKCSPFTRRDGFLLPLDDQDDRHDHRAGDYHGDDDKVGGQVAWG